MSSGISPEASLAAQAGCLLKTIERNQLRRSLRRLGLRDIVLRVGLFFAGDTLSVAIPDDLFHLARQCFARVSFEVYRSEEGATIRPRDRGESELRRRMLRNMLKAMRGGCRDGVGAE